MGNELRVVGHLLLYWLDCPGSTVLRHMYTDSLIKVNIDLPMDQFSISNYDLQLQGDILTVRLRCL